MRHSVQEIYDKLSGRDVFVIGGGPSVKNIDLSLLKNEKIVCLNNAYQLFEHATMLFWCDESWVCNHLDTINSHPCTIRFTARHNGGNYLEKDIRTTANASVLKRTGDFGFDPNLDHVKGNNSGALILNFLSNLKVNRIILLGYDMDMTQGTHWHDGHGLAMVPSIYDELFIPSIESMVSSIKQLGVEVINCNPKSKLNCFTKKDFREFMNERKGIS